MERRTLVRLLVGLGIGVPVLVEVATFLGLFERRLLDGDDGGGPTATPRPDRVGVGDELLPDTPPSDVVTEARVRTGEGGWSFELEVTVENRGDAPYELRLGDVTTTAGRTVDGGGSTPRLAPGDAGEAFGQWTLPEGATPDRVEAVGIAFPADGAEPTTVRRSVPLAKVPVEGG